jgi:receptor protein-tyrosine kinase
MSTDLIKRAAERLSRERDRSLIEQAAERLRQKQSAPSPTIAAPAASNGTMAALETAPALMPEAPNRRTSKLISIDLGRLARAGMVTSNSGNTRIAEEFRIVKRPLLLKAFADGDQRIKNGHLIMVTSARPSEGKTFVSLNLAMSMASEKNLNVLLVDADFQHPSIPGRLGFTSDKGLLDVLTDDKVDLAEVLLRTDVPNLTILPAGLGHPQATELLASQKMARLMEDIAQRYNDRVVIIDAPPVLASSEPGVLALHVGQIILVVEAESTSRRAVEEALSMVNACQHVSLVLNKRRPWPGSEQFGAYYYGYGST